MQGAVMTNSKRKYTVIVQVVAEVEAEYLEEAMEIAKVVVENEVPDNKDLSFKFVRASVL